MLLPQKKTRTLHARVGYIVPTLEGLELSIQALLAMLDVEIIHQVFHLSPKSFQGTG